MNSLESDQDQQYVWSWSGSIQFDTLIFFPEISWKYLLWKESADDNKITKFVACKIYIKKSMQSDQGLFVLFFEQNNLFTKR